MKSYFQVLETKEQKNNFISLEKYIYKKGILSNLIISIFIFINLLFVIPFSLEDLVKFSLIFVCFFGLAEFGLGPIINKFITFRVSNETYYFYTTDLDKQGRTNLLKKIQLLPRFKSIETMTYHLLISILICIISNFYIHFETIYFVYMLITFLIYSYFAGLLSWHINEKIATDIALYISQQGIYENDIANKKFYGVSLTLLFFMYIIFPILSMTILFSDSFILLMKSKIDNIGIFYFLGVTNILFLILLVFMYFEKIKRYNGQIQTALKNINRDTVSTTEETFPVDYANTISYSMYLINRTILLFQKILSNYQSVNNSMEKVCETLSEISITTKATISEQSASVEEIFATIENNNSLSKKITNKIVEVINIADKNLEAVKDNYQELDNNLYRLQEITEENEKTINGIQTLSSKINTVQDIINLINSVASQSKIIAFNAEIESSKANTSENLSFVSQEIRYLAEQTIDLTQEIKEKIFLIKKASQSLIEQGQISMKKINEENQIAQSLKNKFNSIRFSATSTASDAGKIKEFIIEQNNAMEEIGKNLISISSNSKQFLELSSKIQNIINILKTNSEYLFENKDSEIREQN